MLKIQNFSKSYNNHTIIAVENLEIPEGIHWFKGVNGSGKSTFFRSVAGIIPFEGQISWNNLDIRKDAIAYRMQVNMSEAEPLYPDYLTGYDLIKFIADAKKANQNQINLLATRLGVDIYWKNTLGTYSSGMLKKISLLTAFLGQPKLIMLDEPLITIDDRSVQIVYELVKEYAENSGVSFLLSSHQDFRFEKLAIKNMYHVQNQAITQL
ncbi:ABC-type transporter ATP-binding protein EcsA [Emticicia aquatica]|uniref:ABC-type transporter ATP-binding protein EcsA n=1 Tax=Emticicia aquatica TaxID=1681835 RepID=A0ABM9AMU1_9BACT|nr:ABC transporter ATP-binding protein [Emticicia aquatica]CAH0994590.1 ABC-type transporter ATP-binding protein EcsA [Emticicia aquatica]